MTQFTSSIHTGTTISYKHNLRMQNITQAEGHIDPEAEHEDWSTEFCDFIPTVKPDSKKHINTYTKEIYEHYFGQALKEYNQKQIANSRLNRVMTMEQYMEKISADKRGNRADNKASNNALIHEAIVGVYAPNYEDRFKNLDRTAFNKLSHTEKRKVIKELGGYDYVADEQTIKSMCKDAVTRFKDDNPNFKIVGVYYHADEYTSQPHVHIDYIPVAYENKQGLSIQKSVNGAYKEMGFKPIPKAQSPTGKTIFEKEQWREDRINKIDDYLVDKYKELELEPYHAIMSGDKPKSKHKSQYDHKIEKEREFNEQKLNSQEAQIYKRDKALAQKDRQLRDKNIELANKDDTLKEMENEFNEKYKNYSDKLSKVNATLTENEQTIFNQNKEISQNEQTISKQNIEVEDLKEETKELRDIMSHTLDIHTKSTEEQKRHNELVEKNKELNDKNTWLSEVNQNIEARDRIIKENRILKEKISELEKNDTLFKKFLSFKGLGNEFINFLRRNKSKAVIEKEKDWERDDI